MENETVQRLKELFEAYSKAYNDNIMLGMFPADSKGRGGSVQVGYEHITKIAPVLMWKVEYREPSGLEADPFIFKAHVVVDGIEFHVIMTEDDFNDCMLQRAKAMESEKAIAEIYPKFIENWVKPQQALEEIKNQHRTDPTADNEIFGTGGKQ